MACVGPVETRPSGRPLRAVLNTKKKGSQRTPPGARHSLAHCKHFECKQVGGNLVCCKITSQRLLDQSQAGVYWGKHHIPPHFGPFWAYSRTLPQGVELLV